MMNFLEDYALKTTTVVLNLKKMLNQFYISDWKVDSYEMALRYLAPAICDFYQLDNFEIGYKDTTNKHYRLLFSHTTDFNEEKLANKINNFFVNLKDNPNYDAETVKAWLLQDSLNEILPNKDKNQIKRKI